VSRHTCHLPNIRLHLVPPSSNTWSGDGSLEEFGEYANHPLSIGVEYDFVLVDGRARNLCLSTSYRLAPRGIIVLHDANRAEYSTDAFASVQSFLTGDRRSRGIKLVAHSAEIWEGLDLQTFADLGRFYSRFIEPLFLARQDEHH
jgi:hypothetical protein